MNLKDLKDFISIIQPLLTMSAIIWGGVWSYMLFIRKRQVAPRANIEHSITYKSLTANKSLLHLTVKITNIGNVLIVLKDADIRLQKISPIAPELLEYIEQGEVPLLKYSNEGDWPKIGGELFSLQDRVEPGETHELYYDFILDNNIKLVKVYSHFTNIKIWKKKPSREIGWGLSTLHELDVVG